LKGRNGFGGSFDFGYYMEKFSVSVTTQMPIQLGFFLPKHLLLTESIF
jgi:hypothetical protein